MSLVDDLILVSNDKFKYKDPKELREYYEQAIKENRLFFLRNNGVVGYLIYYIFDKKGLDEYLASSNGKFPEHKPNEKYLYIDENVIFSGKKMNYLPLRKQFKTMYPQLKEVYWHNLNKPNRRLFKYKEIK